MDSEELDLTVTRAQLIYLFGAMVVTIGLDRLSPLLVAEGARHQEGAWNGDKRAENLALQDLTERFRRVIHSDLIARDIL